MVNFDLTRIGDATDEILGTSDSFILKTAADTNIMENIKMKVKLR